MKAVLLIACAALCSSAHAAVYDLPPEGVDVIGSLSTVTATYEDTLIDIARRHGLGYQDIVRANPGVNVWVPGEGTEVILPNRFVLPPGPREGLVLNLAEYRMYYFPQPKDGEPAKVHTYRSVSAAWTGRRRLARPKLPRWRRTRRGIRRSRSATSMQQKAIRCRVLYHRDRTTRSGPVRFVLVFRAT